MYQIRIYRVKHKMTQNELAKRIGSYAGTVSRWETGVTVPPVGMLSKMADLFGCTIEDLIRGDEDVSVS